MNDIGRVHVTTCQSTEESSTYSTLLVNLQYKHSSRILHNLPSAAAPVSFPSPPLLCYR